MRGLDVEKLFRSSIVPAIRIQTVFHIISLLVRFSTKLKAPVRIFEYCSYLSTLIALVLASTTNYYYY